MKRLSMLLCLIIVLSLLAACGASEPEVVKETVKETVIVEGTPQVVEKEVTSVVEVTAVPDAKGGSVTVGMNREPDMLDPNVGSSRYDDQVNVNIFNNLVYRDNELNFVPGLATDWEVDDTGMIWTVTLREGVTFHDGTPFNAESAKANFDRISDPGTKSRKAAGLLGSPQVTVDGEYGLQFKYDAPMPAFLDALSNPSLGVVSPASVAEHGEDVGRHPVGTGPFKFVEWVSADHISLERNDDYDWAPPYLKHEGPAYLESLSFQFIPEDVARAIALETGEVDAVIRLPEELVVRFSTDPNFEVVRAIVPGTPVLIMVNGTKPPTDDIKVRQALEYAVHQEPVIQAALFNVGYKGYGPMSQANPCYDETLETKYSYDPEKANALLDEAGWVMNESTGIREKDGEPLSIVYITFPAPTYRMRIAEQVQAQYREVGVDMEILPMESPQIQTARQAGDHNLAFLNWLGMDPAVLEVLFYSTNIGTGWNFTHYPSAELDAILDEAGQEMDPDKRCELYASAQQLIMDEAMLVPLVLQEMVVGQNVAIKDMGMSPYGEMIEWYDAYVE